MRGSFQSEKPACWLCSSPFPRICILPIAEDQDQPKIHFKSWMNEWMKRVAFDQNRSSSGIDFFIHFHFTLLSVRTHTRWNIQKTKQKLETLCILFSVFFARKKSLIFQFHFLKFLILLAWRAKKMVSL